jgi:hypothetical protein
MSAIFLALWICLILTTSGDAAGLSRKKVLFVDSYHAGYAWSDGVTAGVLKGLNVKMTPHGELDCGKSPVELMVVRMDTKRNQTEGFKKQAALNVKSRIETWKPDVVIASDDNASKYLIVPHFKDKELPFVFCGVNWDASVYGFPCSNVTGMEEVTFVPQTIAILNPCSTVIGEIRGQKGLKRRRF